MTEWFEKYTGLLILGFTVIGWVLVISLGVVRFVEADDTSDDFRESAPKIKKRLAEHCDVPMSPHAGQKIVNHVNRHWSSTGPLTQSAYDPRLLAKPHDKIRGVIPR